MNMDNTTNEDDLMRSFDNEIIYLTATDIDLGKHLKKRGTIVIRRDPQCYCG